MAFCKCNKPIVQIFVASGRIPSCRPIGAGLMSPLAANVQLSQKPRYAAFTI